MLFRLVITDLQYKSQNAEVPMGPKQPGPTVVISLVAIPPTNAEAADLADRFRYRIPGLDKTF